MSEPTVEQQLRDAFGRDPRSVNAVALAAGIPQATLQRWWTTPGATLAMRHLNALCRELGLELREME